jgi:2-methylaconitate cis-trans-isomerase PrpF
MSNVEIQATLMRGGTSRGLFLRRDQLPGDLARQLGDRIAARAGAGASPATPEVAATPSIEALLLALMGSPDPMQIDGLGGSSSVTSKVMIVDTEHDADGRLGYTFAQVAIDKAVVDFGGTCGNLTAAVGAFAVDEGLWPATEPATRVRLYNHNTAKVIEVEVPTRGGRARSDGDYRIAGIARTGAEIICRYLDPGGSVFDATLPTGRPVETIDAGEAGHLEVSIVDVTNPLVFVRAGELGLAGTELPVDVDTDPGMLARIEAVRGAVATHLGLASSPAAAAVESPGIPKLSFVSPPADYVARDGTQVRAADIDVTARIMSMQRLHPSFALTGVMCTAAAALLPGTIVHEIARVPAEVTGGGDVRVAVGHPSGITDALVGVTTGESGTLVRSTGVSRTARRLFTGVAYAEV